MFCGGNRFSHLNGENKEVASASDRGGFVFASDRAGLRKDDQTRQTAKQALDLVVCGGWDCPCTHVERS
jgi:hypothetical protein